LAEEDAEPIEKKQLSLSFTNQGGIFVNETSTLYSQKRNGVGAKFKLEKGEYVVDNLIGENTDTILFFTSHGNFYHTSLGQFTIDEKAYLSNYVTTLPYEHIVAAAITSKQNTKPYIIFITKNGILKKSEFSEYNLKRNVGATAIKLDEGDEIISVLFTSSDKIGISSTQGNFIMIGTSDIRPIGRVARGVCGIKLNDGDSVASARVIDEGTTELISVSEDGYIKRSSLSEFHITGRATKGVKLQGTSCLCDFLPVSSTSDILVVSSAAQIRIKLGDIPLLSRGAQGVKAIKLSENSKIMNLSNL
jgi:DNA gyrase subunit A